MRWRRRRADEDFAREIQSHLDLETERLIGNGLSPSAARDAARRSFGNVLTAQERFHEAHGWVWLEQALLDLRYAWRGLRRSPAFLATAVLTLAVGLGLVTSLFAIFNAYVLRPFAVREPQALHKIIWRSKDAGGFQFRWREYEAIRARRELFDDVIASTTRVVVSGGRPTIAMFVSGNFFEVLGPGLRLGRGLAPYDAASPGVSPVAVLSDDGWARLFDRDPSVLGARVDLNGVSVTVVGVLRPEFSGLDDTPRDIVVPVTMFGAIAKTEILTGDQPREVGLVARFRQGVTAAQAEAALTPYLADITERREPVHAETPSVATPNPLTVGLLVVLSPVFTAFALVLVAACANVSNVMLARATARQREIAMRLSLGASRGRVVRQLLTEGLLIALLAAAAGLLLSLVTLRIATAAFFAGLPSSIVALVRVAPLDFDHRVFGFALAMAAATMVVFALVPALHATRVSLTPALRNQSGATARGSRLRGALVISQVTVSLVLLVAAATLVRNGVAVGASGLGFETRGVISVKPWEQAAGLIGRAADVLIADARVGEVAATSGNPLSERLARTPIVPVPGAAMVPTSYKFVSPEFFSVLRIPIVHGRNFTAAEARAEAPVAIVSAAGARALWPGADPIGKVIKVQVDPLDVQDGNIMQAPALEGGPVFDAVIVGVAGDVVSGLMMDGVDPSHLYLPMHTHGPRAAHLLLRERAPGELPAESVRAVLRPVHSDPLAFEALPLDDLRVMQMFPVTTASWIGSALGLLALALSVSGLYGVLIYTLSQRTREIGIRVALGATGAAVVRLVMGQSAHLAGVGAAIGLVLACGALGLIGSVVRLRSVTWLDPGAFAVGLVLVGLATAAASFVPAWRATRVDPAETLRSE